MTELFAQPQPSDDSQQGRKSQERPRRERVSRAAKRSTATYATDDDPEPGRCAARAKRSGERCKLRAAKGKRVCRKHGANAGRPPKHGRFSTFTDRMRESYDRWMEHVGELDFTNHLAAMAATAERCIERSQKLDTPDFREEALRLYAIATGTGTNAERVEALALLGQLLRRGGEEDRALRATSETLERFGRRMERAKEIELREEMTVRMGDLDSMVANIISILLRHGDVGTRVAEEIHAEIIRPAGLLRAV